MKERRVHEIEREQGGDTGEFGRRNMKVGNDVLRISKNIEINCENTLYMKAITCTFKQEIKVRLR